MYVALGKVTVHKIAWYPLLKLTANPLTKKENDAAILTDLSKAFGSLNHSLF